MEIFFFFWRLKLWKQKNIFLIFFLPIFLIFPFFLSDYLEGEKTKCIWNSICFAEVAVFVLKKEYFILLVCRMVDGFFAQLHRLYWLLWLVHIGCSIRMICRHLIWLWVFDSLDIFLCFRVQIHLQYTCSFLHVSYYLLVRLFFCTYTGMGI